eukprot:2943227-Rhodomonas_salina.3
MTPPAAEPRGSPDNLKVSAHWQTVARGLGGQHSASDVRVGADMSVLEGLGGLQDALLHRLLLRRCPPLYLLVVPPGLCSPPAPAHPRAASASAQQARRH